MFRKTMIEMSCGNFFGCLEEELHVFRDEKDGFQTAVPSVSFGLSLKDEKIEAMSKAKAEDENKKEKSDGKIYWYRAPSKEDGRR